MPNTIDKIENLFSAVNTNDSFLQICSPENLYAGWRKVRANRGAGGIDAVTLKDFERNLQDNLQELSRNLLSGSYRPLPVKFVKVMKANGKMRELGILTVRDRTAQRAVLDAVEPKFEAKMHDCNFAFRAGRNLEMAIQQILVSRANGFWWTVEADIENYFGTIDREILLKDVRRLIRDEKVLHLIELWLNAGILEETWWQTGNRKIAQVNTLAYEAITESFDNLLAERYGAADDLTDFPIEFDKQAQLSPFAEEKLKTKNRRGAVKKMMQDGFWLAMSHRALIGKVVGGKLLGGVGLAAAGIALTPALIETYRQRFHPRKGILQGSSVSPVLGNLYLTEFDEKFTGSDTRLVRYCDDFVILCRTEAAAKKALSAARRNLEKRHLKLHPEKTRILSPTDEFEFLGYRFLSNGTIEPPPTATNEMARKLKQMSEKVGAKFRRENKKIKGEKIVEKTEVGKMKVVKTRIKTWEKFLDMFDKKK